MAAACGSVEDSSGCAGVGALMAGLWVATGGLAALAVEGSSRVLVAPSRPADLKPYARFPQGPPAGLDLKTLGPPAPSQDE